MGSDIGAAGISASIDIIDKSPAMSCHGKGACRDEEHVPHQLWTGMGPVAALAAAQLCIFLLHLVL